MSRRWLMIEILMLMLLVTGCAKRPSMAQVSAPAPAGGAVTPATRRAPEPPAGWRTAAPTSSRSADKTAAGTDR